MLGLGGIETTTLVGRGLSGFLGFLVGSSDFGQLALKRGRIGRQLQKFR
jgi:hypothetical protein